MLEMFRRKPKKRITWKKAIVVEQKEGNFQIWRQNIHHDYGSDDENDEEAKEDDCVINAHKRASSQYVNLTRNVNVDQLSTGIQAITMLTE